MKKSFTSVLALILAVSMLLCFAACGNKDTGETTTAAPATQAAENVDETVADTQPATEAVESGETEPTLATEESSAAAEESSAAAEIVAPTDAAGTLALYNNTINNAFAAKVGFNKERITDNEKLDAGLQFQTFKSLVYKFMGIGADNKYTEVVSKGKWDSDSKKNYLRKSTLTAADITGATCVKSGANYIITINVKSGSSKGSAGSRSSSSSIDKCGICVGNEDKGYYDHKTGPVIYDALDDTFSKAVVSEKYSNAKIVATVDAATGNLVKLNIDFDVKTSIDTGSIGVATATGTTHIAYSKFVY